MKNVLTAAILFILILFISFFSVRFLKNMCSSMHAANSKIINYINKDNWKEAEKLSYKFSDDWHSYSNVSTIFVNHTLIDDIIIEEHKMEEFVKCKNKDEALSSSSTIQFLLDRINKLETINFQNLF